MKKVFCFLLVSFFAVFSLCFAQSVTTRAAARRTAERCLKLSENYLLAEDPASALYQAELGISYDDSISDLFYVKAVSKKKLGATVREVTDLSETAKEKNNWIGYNEKGNRILLADHLSDTGRLDEALEELDRKPFVFSADAEAVRIKTYYRMGTDESFDKAREKINSARRIYKGDERFLSLFYNFELSNALHQGLSWEPEVKVLQMADVLSQEMKNYKNISPETESASLFFMQGENQIRSLKAFDAAGKKDYLFPVTAYKAGYWTEEKAFEEFFKYADESVTFEVLEYFLSLLTNCKEDFYNHMNAYNGTLFVDTNRDFQWEASISYERGRPQYIHYDAENDGVEDLSGTMDFGELLSVNILPLETELFYSEYPYLGRAVLHRDDNYVVFDFAKKAAIFSPLEFATPFHNLLSEYPDEFYVPVVKRGWNDVSNLDYLANATFIRTDASERENAFVTYSLLDGNVVSAVFTENDKIYASVDFENSFPHSRYSDYDNDGLYETLETFSVFTDDIKDYFTSEDKLNVKKMFPFFDYSEDVYLSSIQIDNNNDNIPEYREFFREKGGRTSIWLKADGRTETFVVYPKNPDEPLVEESIFVVGLNQDTVSVLMVDGVPSSVKLNDVSFKVIPGELENFFWFQKEGDGGSEVLIAQTLASVDNGHVVPVTKEKDFYNAIKVSGMTFARKIELSEFENEKNPENETDE